MTLSSVTLSSSVGNTATPLFALLAFDASNQLAELTRRFVVLPMWASETLALWILHTYAYGLRPRMRRIGDSVGRGYSKSDFLEVWRRYIPRSEFEAWTKDLKGKL